MQLAQVKDIFGKIKPPQGVPSGDPNTVITNLISFGIRTFFVVGGITSLIYLLWGTFDWITSSGDKERLGKARGKMWNAFIGVLMIVVVLSVVYLLEKVIFAGKLCFGINCKIQLTPLGP